VADRRVTATGKDRDENITKLCGPCGKVSKAKAIDDIESEITPTTSQNGTRRTETDVITGVINKGISERMPTGLQPTTWRIFPTAKRLHARWVPAGKWVNGRGMTPRTITVAAAIVLAASAAAAQGVSPCPADSVAAGTLCLDKYEASVWRVPNPTTTNAALPSKIQRGTATAADLAASGAVQLGAGSAGARRLLPRGRIARSALGDRDRRSDALRGIRGSPLRARAARAWWFRAAGRLRGSAGTVRANPLRSAEGKLPLRAPRRLASGEAARA